MQSDFSVYIGMDFRRLFRMQLLLKPAKGDTNHIPMMEFGSVLPSA
jgi:hypothetical protein